MTFVEDGKESDRSNHNIYNSVARVRLKLAILTAIAMSVTVESDLKDILTKIDTRLDRIEQSLVELKVGQARLEEKVEGLSKRIDNQEFISRGVLIGLIVAIAGGAAKLFGFIGNP